VSEVDKFLAHYGVKGMKWGVRRDRSPEAKAARRAATKKAVKQTLVVAGATYVATQIALGAVSYAASPPKTSSIFVNQALGQIGNKVVADVVDGAYDISTLRRR